MSIAVIAGEGIGKEVVPAGIACVDAALARHHQSVTREYYDWGSDYYLQHGAMMPKDGLATLGKGPRRNNSSS